jgi:A/G-specific adenine glycosylase
LSSVSLNPKEVTEFQRQLRSWFENNKRNLPWRQERDPYSVWLSEVILQQTQVATGLSYYKNFKAKYPSLKHFAEASQEDILAMWAGLGYYRRARLLHEAARLVLRDYNGVIPSDYNEFLKLPGVGPYTASAVMSIAHGKPYAVLDGNVERVLARQFAIGENARDPKTKKKLMALADTLLDRENPGSFNEALMETGALICKPKKPLCESCPVRFKCRARDLGSPEDYPVLPKQKKEKLLRKLLWIEKENHVLLRRRGEKEWYTGLWDLPGGREAESTMHLKQLKQNLCGKKALLGVRHGITKYMVESRVYLFDLSLDKNFKKPRGSEWVWRRKSEVIRRKDELPSPTRKLIEKFEKKLEAE